MKLGEEFSDDLIVADEVASDVEDGDVGHAPEGDVADELREGTALDAVEGEVEGGD